MLLFLFFPGQAGCGLTGSQGKAIVGIQEGGFLKVKENYVIIWSCLWAFTDKHNKVNLI